MSTLKVTNLRHESATSDNLTLDSAGNVSAPGNLSVTGSTTITDDLNVDSGNLFVNSSINRIGIGTVSPDYRLDVNGEVGITEGQPVTWHDGTGSAAAQIFATSGHDLVFRTNAAGNERMRVLAGGGLTFNGDTAAANALDDYEEGTWTPTWGGTSTYTTQVGRYTKVGNKVTIWFAVRCTLIGTGGSVTLSGLPFGTASTVDSAIPLAYWQNINSNAYWLTAYAPGGGYTGLYFMGQQGLDATQEVNLSVGKSSAVITGSGTYLVP